MNSYNMRASHYFNLQMQRIDHCCELKKRVIEENNNKLDTLHTHSYTSTQNGIEKKLRFDLTRNKQFILYWILLAYAIKNCNRVRAEMEAKGDLRDGAHHLKSTKLAFQIVFSFLLARWRGEGVRGKGTLRIEITENFMVKMSFTQLFHSLVVCYFRECVRVCVLMRVY